MDRTVKLARHGPHLSIIPRRRTGARWCPMIPVWPGGVLRSNSRSSTRLADPGFRCGACDVVLVNRYKAALLCIPRLDPALMDMEDPSVYTDPPCCQS